MLPFLFSISKAFPQFCECKRGGSQQFFFLSLGACFEIKNSLGRLASIAFILCQVYEIRGKLLLVSKQRRTDFQTAVVTITT